jgi:hypothetical protein
MSEALAVQMKDLGSLLKTNLDSLALCQDPKLSVRLRIRLNRHCYPHRPPPGRLEHAGAEK